MKSILLILMFGLFLCSQSAYSQERNFLGDIYSFIENPRIFAINQEPGHVPLVPFSNSSEALMNNQDQSKGFKSLNGTWKFKWLPTPDQVPKNFYFVKFNDQEWDNIKVPGNWEMQGFGDPVFRNVSQPFRSNPPYVPHDYNPTGCYRRTFSVPENWQGKQIFLRMEAVTSASFLWINGKELGFNEGANEPAEYNVTKYLQKGTNTLAVCVTKYSAGTYLEDQDFWRLSGIFRDVSLLAVPNIHIRDYYITTDLDSLYRDASLNIQAEIMNYSKAAANGYSVRGTLFDKNRQPVGTPFESEKVILKSQEGSLVKLSAKVKNPGKWSSEHPELYSIVLELIDFEGKAKEVLGEKIGFKKTEVKHQVLLVNGVPVKLNGVNSHMQHPDLGHTMDVETIRKDLVLMKQFNINCVRTSHYPPNIEYLKMADELGMYIVDETGDESHATEYISNLPEWKNAYLDRVRGMVLRDRNHPSILFWSAGNESGIGNNICEVIREGKSLDPGRLFMYGGNSDDVAWKNEVPCEDIIGPRYATPYELRTRIAQVQESQDPRPSFMDEYISVEGNGGGGFDEYWEVIYNYPRLSGGAIWDWVSPGIREKIQLLKDDSPNKISVALKGRGKLGEGKFGSSAALNGHDQWIDVYRDPALDITGKQLTLSLWVLPGKWNGNGQMITKGSYQFGINQFAKDSIEFFVSETEKKVLKVRLPESWEYNWHHVAGIYNGSNLMLYVDGIKSGQMPFSGSITNKPFPVNIGRFSDMEGQEYSDNLSNAKFDRVCIFNKVIPVDKLVATTPGLKDEAKLWLDFDELEVKGEFYSMGIGGRTYGLIWPDRQPQPELYQVKKSAQPVHVELINPSDGTIEITNRFHDTNLNELATTWQLQEDGEAIQHGTLNLNIAPLEKLRSTIPWKKPEIHPGSEYRLLVSFALKRSSPYAAAGHEVAWDQLELPWQSPAGELGRRSVPNIEIKERDELVSVTGKDFEYIFNRNKGLLTRLNYAGKDLLQQGGKLSVWRAPLANDLDNWGTHSANLYPRKTGSGNFPAGSWFACGLDHLNFKPENFSIVQKDSNRVVISILDHVEGANYTTAFDNQYLYTIDGTGEITIDHTFTPQGVMPSWLPKIGMQWVLDSSMNQVKWYGRGPFETYPDRKTGAKIGIFQKSVQEMAESYLVPQDYGCRTDNRWVELQTSDGTGLRFSGSSAFSFSAQLFTTDNLSRARYPYQLQPADGIIFNFDYITSGVGCTAISVLDKYRVLPGVLRYTTHVKPFRK